MNQLAWAKVIRDALIDRFKDAGFRNASGIIGNPTVGSDSALLPGGDCECSPEIQLELGEMWRAGENWPFPVLDTQAGAKLTTTTDVAELIIEVWTCVPAGFDDGGSRVDDDVRDQSVEEVAKLGMVLATSMQCLADEWRRNPSRGIIFADRVTPRRDGSRSAWRQRVLVPVCLTNCESC